MKRRIRSLKKSNKGHQEKGLYKGISLLSSRTMSNSLKGENKLEGASNNRAWKKRIDLILEKNKVLDLVKGKVKKPTDE